MNNTKVDPIIYLDNASTTKPSRFVIDAVLTEMYEQYGNPSSLHDIGRKAKIAVEESRKIIADSIGAKPSEIYFTSGGSESDNLALRGIVPHLKEIGRTTIITSLIEHPAVLNTCKNLEKDGLKVIYMPVDQDGRVDIEELDKVMSQNKDDIGLASIMAVNNEVGSIQLIDDIGDLCQEYGAIFMTDAVQALGHIHLDVNKSHIDLMAMSGHKIHAMKGIGALYVRNGIKLTSLITGGGQENHLRAGTENVPGIISMGKAVEQLNRRININTAYYEYLRDLFFSELNLLDVYYIENCSGGVPHIISLTIPKCESEAMLLLLNQKGIYISAGSACTAGSLEPSHVLKALHLSDQDASCTIRISMSMYNTSNDMIRTAHAISDCAQQLQSMLE